MGEGGLEEDGAGDGEGVMRVGVLEMSAWGLVAPLKLFICEVLLEGILLPDSGMEPYSET